MADVKWIKLDVDMFSNPKIKRLRRLPDGNNVILIWVMLLTMAGRCNASGLIFITQNIPYTIEDLADELGFSVDTVKFALRALEEMGMITTDSNKLEIPGWTEHQHEEGLEKIRKQNADRQAKFREKQKVMQIEEKSNVTNNVTDNVTVTHLSYSYSYSISNIVNYLNNKLNSNYKSNTNNTVKHITARLKEGYTEEDFYLVIDSKVADWKDDPKMRQYLRPDTLFGTKFESYLQNAPKPKKEVKVEEQIEEEPEMTDEEWIEMMKASVGNEV